MNIFSPIHNHPTPSIFYFLVVTIKLHDISQVSVISALINTNSERKRDFIINISTTTTLHHHIFPFSAHSLTHSHSQYSQAQSKHSCLVFYRFKNEKKCSFLVFSSFSLFLLMVVYFLLFLFCFFFNFCALLSHYYYY